MVDIDNFALEPANGFQGHIGGQEGLFYARPSPPKTPAPVDSLGATGPLRWDRHDFESPEFSDSETSRPSTARSSRTFASVFTQLSNLSDDWEPEAEQYSKYGTASSSLPVIGDPEETIRASRQHLIAKRAYWSRPLEQHLWKTYLSYQDDATVTPYKVGPNNVPPPGVLRRVASRAKQTWKGAGSDSDMPTTAGYMEWSHSGGATRDHLRELCISHGRANPRASQFRERSTTPSYPTAIRFRNRRLDRGNSSTPCPFSGRDMAFSLVVSTAPSMQAEGPLAQLSRCTPTPSVVTDVLESRQRLASPFTAARTYGPSSSVFSAREDGLDLTQSSRKHQTAGPHDLLSAATVLSDEDRQSTGKRRARQSILEPPRAKRPTLTSDLWTDPSTAKEQDPLTTPIMPPASTVMPDPEPCSSPQVLRDTSPPQVNLFARLNALHGVSDREVGGSLPASTHLAPTESLGRLGSPFGGRLTSFSFPGRISRAPVTSTRDLPRAFATMTPSINRPRASTRASLSNHQSHINERLRDICRRACRRSQSPR